MEVISRTDKKLKSLNEFSGQVLVLCPHCKKRASVITEFGQYYYVKSCKFRCNNCFKRVDEKLWYGPVIISPLNAKCGYCGFSFRNEKKYVLKYQSKMKVRCSGCGNEQLYKTNYQLTYADNHQATDPFLGLQLWLQIPVDTNIFWAYNHEHLAFLKNYVAAKLREEEIVSKYSLRQKLPNFIKLAKNRDKILKVIEKLEKK
jgi:hypothetical protein